jgi:glycosyltransferase involved in cell wall biosynthesis
MKVPALYFCDFPPLNLGGGGLLMEYLLKNYPPDRLTILTGSHYFNQASRKSRSTAPENYVVFPVSSATGRWGLGRFLLLLNWLALPLVALQALSLVKRRRIRVILSVAHGQFFLAAAVLARFTGVPLVLWVHDDWVAMTERRLLPRFCLSYLFSRALKSASHIYAVSERMADWLRSEYNVEAEIQLPCSEGLAVERPGEPAGGTFRVAFAGTNVGTGDTLQMLAEVVAKGIVLPDGRRVELHLYMPVPAGPEIEPSRCWWRQEGIVVHPWLSQVELQRELSQADLLFLPYNFSPRYTYLWAHSFPTKAAEYLRYAKPVLLMAPPGAAIVSYARAHGFAAIIDRPDKDLLVDAIRRIATDVSYREMLSARALDAFRTNHDAGRQRSAVYALMDGLSRLSVPPYTARNFPNISA